MDKNRAVRRDLIVFVVFFTLVTGVLWIPRANAETFEESGSIVAGYAATSITLGDFELNCTYPPDSQGLDAYIFQIPPSLGTGNAIATGTGDGLAYDLDMFFLDASCTEIGEAFASAAVDETGPVPAGTLYIALANFRGAETTATLTVVGPGGGPGGGASATPTKSGSASPSVRPSASPSASGSSRPSNSPAPPGAANRTTIASDKNQTGYKKPFKLSGRVTGDDGCTGPYKVSLKKRIAGTDTFTVADPDVPVAADGTWSKIMKSSVSASYTASVASNQSCSGSSSLARTVQVRVKITIKKPIRCDDPFTVEGTVLPKHTGTSVYLQQRKGLRWVTLDKGPIDEGSRYALGSRTCRVPLRVQWPSQSKRNLPGSTRIHF